MTTTKQVALWPELHLAEWQETYMLVHLLTQMVGKIKLQFVPFKNHWWNISFLPTVRGLTTGTIPFDNVLPDFARYGEVIALELLAHVRTSDRDVPESFTKDADNGAAMIAATPATIDINYILSERSREFFGEDYRWYDLARTQKWEEFVGSYQICNVAGATTPLTVQRELEKYLYLRPIPSAQLQRMSGDDEYKANYQNPGYN